MCSREIFTKKCQQQQIFDSDLKGAWHYNHVTFTPIASKFMLYCRLIYMLSILCVRLTIKVKVGIPESFKVGWYPPRKTGSSHLKSLLGVKGLSWKKKLLFKAKFSPSSVIPLPRQVNFYLNLILISLCEETDAFLKFTLSHSFISYVSYIFIIASFV